MLFTFARLVMHVTDRNNELLREISHKKHEYKKRLLLRCKHDFKSDLVNNMDHIYKEYVKFNCPVPFTEKQPE